MKKTLLLIFFICLLAQISFAENKKLDSLKVLLKEAKQDTLKLRLYVEVCKECEYMKNLIYANPALKLADKILLQPLSEQRRKRILNWKLELLQFNLEYYANHSDQNTRLEFDKKRLAIFRELKDTNNIINEISTISYVYGAIGNIPQCLEYNQLGLSIFQQMKYQKGKAFFLNELAKTYYANGDTLQALENYKKGLKIYIQLKDTDGIALMYNNIGILYYEGKKTKLCSEYYTKAIDLIKRQKKSQYFDFANYARIATMYREMGNLENALLYNQKSLDAAIKRKQLWWESQALGGIALIYSLMGDTSKAIEKNLESIKSAQKNEYGGVTYPNLHLARIYFKKRNYYKANYYNEIYLNSAKKLGIVSDVKEGEKLGSSIDSANGNFKSAYYHYKNYISLRDQIKSNEVTQAATKEKYQEEYYKQKATQEKKDALAKAESKKQKLIILFVVVGLLTVVVFAGFIFRSLRIRNKQNKIISEQKKLVEEKNRDILSSIEYALRIQTAILPPQRVVKQYLENSFILYKPKDIVAGDFYWMEEAPSNSPEGRESGSSNSSPSGRSGGASILFAACDCTGHGVPGAMVSVVCHNALNRAVREFGLTKPSEILDKTQEIVLENFSKSEEDIKDGMDISLCALNFSKVQNFGKTESDYKVELQWAGANNPLWIVRGEASPLGRLEGLLETKADKQPIGMNEDSHPFTNHTFTLNSGDTIYIFSDGFADQFSPADKKLMKKNFKQVLLSIQDKSMTEQHDFLKQYIENWKGNMEQTDDILLMGVRV